MVPNDLPQEDEDPSPKNEVEEKSPSVHVRTDEKFAVETAKTDGAANSAHDVGDKGKVDKNVDVSIDFAHESFLFVSQRRFNQESLLCLSYFSRYAQKDRPRSPLTFYNFL